MRRSMMVWAALLLVQFLAGSALAQAKLEGRWVGKVKSIQGERDANASFKKEGDNFTGTISGLRPGQDIALKDIKVDGDKVTAIAEVETPMATIVINYKFTLAGDSLNGQGALEFSGNAISFDVELKRDTGAAASATSGGGSSVAQAPAQRPQQQRPTIEQPQQKQSIDYFIGKWSFKFVGRESALGPAPREGVVVFTKRADGKSADGVVTGTADGKPYKDTIVLSLDAATKMLSISEKLASGAQVNSTGDWTSPIAIRFAPAAVSAKGQKLQLRRLVSIIAAHSFSITDELSEDGGPFARLGNAVYAKVQ
ncbi:MAG TPA: hypothetical protein PLK30_07185 [Blastocatellia bacterium]|nr:hypothetical protein [Blastocatellia bacterium]